MWRSWGERKNGVGWGMGMGAGMGWGGEMESGRRERGEASNELRVCLIEL